MTRSVAALAALILAACLGGCSFFNKVTDPKKDWQAPEYYKAAHEEFESGNWDAAIKLYEQLEAKFPFGRFADQAQLEKAYAYYKQTETAQAVSTLDKFIKAHPNHPNVDYARFPTSPGHREALEIMVEAYDRMNMKELRDDAKRVLAKNYPDDRMSGAGRNTVGRTWWKPWTYW